MVRKLVISASLVLGLLAATALPAQAWDLIAQKTGYGTTTLRSWTRNYNEGAWVVNHGGTRIAVRLNIRCRSGATYHNSWVDGGGRFRQIVHGLGDEGRCNANLHVVPRSSNVQLYLASYARG
jgi:hypothetical protein